ncbi:type VI secretion protein IcmF [Mesorhizobium sp. L-8-10]|uniref:type VI secretion system membrane subunit TssM n=1 Tax=Mesorhizobium sp. L-8-10 TaxID=2744523 RepID=UPI001926DB6B|nr:type VI secretion system membrane subunit TssM [Mesorhizobium sp. L-8-10]BCH35564.1 type VI secretion protein IcmF [Mesorhizobium sp. L-8-10]
MRLGKRLQAIGRVLTTPGALLTLAALLAALFVWLIGPLLAFGEIRPLGPASVRLAIMLVIALAWGVIGYLIRVKRSSEDQALLAALRRQQDEERQAEDQGEAAMEAELSAFRDAARGAMRLVRKGSPVNPFARDRYSMPWYLVMGSDGAGKSAIVRNSGLSLPYQAEATPDTAAGFHVAEQAVIVELSGRFLDPSERPSTPLWLRLLDHLRRLRPQQPVNGILVAVSAGELSVMTAEAVLDFASTLRRRLDEATARLRARPPVYLVVSKLDLLAGFEEFFDALSAEERTAVLGLPLAPSAGGSTTAAERFDRGFADIVERLSQHLLLRLQEEPDDDRRRKAYEFPAQFAAMRTALEPLVAYLTAVHRFEAAPQLRGLFFTSATQNGLAVDMLARHLAAGFAQRPQNLALRHDGGPVHGRPYFLGRLVHDVILPEAGAGGLSRPAEMVARAQGIAANVILTIATFGLIALWWLGFSEGRAYTARLEQGLGSARETIAAAAPAGRAPSDFKPVLAALDDLRGLAEERPGRATLGLYGTSAVEAAARDAYDRSLSTMLLPFAWRYLRDGLDDPQTPAPLRFHQLKLYLMLAGERPLEPSAAALLGPDFTAKWLPYDRTPQADADVSAHLAALAGAGFPAPTADAALVDRARGRLSTYTLARLAYDTLSTLAEIQKLPVWRPVDHMSMAGPQALARVSGQSFWNGIPGLYTRSGFFGSALPASGTVSERLAKDLWVMGVADTIANRQREAQRIRDGLLDLYRVDYIRQWDSLLSDLTMIDGANAGDVARAMALITGKPSPVTELTAAIGAETRMEPDKGPLDGLPGAATAQVERVANTVLSPQRVIDVAAAVTEHFKPYNDAVSAAEGQQSQVDAMLAALEPLYRQINHVATGGDILELAAQPQTLLNQLGEQVSALPDPLQPLFRRILSQAAAVTGGSSRERLAQIWNTTVKPACDATTSGRYPFDPASASDASLSDFSSLLGPNGQIAAFRNDYLKPFIDTSARPWRWRTGQQAGLGLGDDVLGAFEQADDITIAYFAGADAPSVDFVVEPLRLDPKARALQFDIGGPVLVYAHGPVTPTPFHWPPERPDAEASLSMTPEMDGQRNILRRQGPWALFRLFDAARILEVNPTDVVPFGFMVGTRQAVLQVTAPATRNPFVKDLLAEFKCPVL